jgi:DNA repair protein SbcD/Mre11
MRILHTSDWHLGQTLHDISRELEHAQFLAWLNDTLEAERADALIVAGDIFDGANPPASAQRAYYHFLAECRRRTPHLEIVIVGGNHDSPGRLDAPASVLGAFGVHVVGGLPRLPNRDIDVDRAVIPLHDRSGAIRAWAVAAPFLRPSDATLAEREDFPSSVRRIYHALFAAARAKRLPGQALISTGHCYMRGGEISKLSEREIQRGNQDALPVDIFPDDVAYVALGHLHKAQSVGGRPNVRYCGSPLPLALSEKDYRHQVLLVELIGETCGDIKVIPVPRTRDMCIIPETAAALDEALKRLAELPARPESSEKPPALLEVRILLDAPRTNLSQIIRTAIGDAFVELVNIRVERVGAGRSLADHNRRAHLSELSPDDVFVRCYQRSFPKEETVPDDLRRAFHELLDVVRNGGSE